MLDAVVEAPFKLGRGVAFAITCDELVTLRAQIASQFDELTWQDQSWGRPHVTVQNKVEPDIAAALHAELSGGYEPRPATVVGLDLWDYRGGPWSHVSRQPFGQ